MLIPICKYLHKYSPVNSKPSWSLSKYRRKNYFYILFRKFTVKNILREKWVPTNCNFNGTLHITVVYNGPVSIKWLHLILFYCTRYIRLLLIYHKLFAEGWLRYNNYLQLLLLSNKVILGKWLAQVISHQLTSCGMLVTWHSYVKIFVHVMEFRKK